MADSASASAEGSTAMYVLGIAILLGAIVLSAAMWMSVSSLSTAISSKNFDVNVNGGAAAPTAAAAVAPSVAAPAAAPAPTAPANIDISGRPVRGDPNAKVTLIEFSDYQCPYCRSAEPTVDEIMSDYQGKVKMVYMEFPLSSIHPYAQKAAEAAECANAQGKFWAYHDQLFNDSQGLDVPSLKAAAAAMGLDTAKFNACLDGGQMTAAVSAMQNLGSANGVGGTPSFFINGVSLVGAQPYAQFKQAIDAALAS